MKRLIAFSLAVLLTATAFGNVWDAVQLKGRTDKENPVSYKIGEPIVFSLKSVDVPPELEAEGFVVEWKRTGDDGRTERGIAPFKSGEVCTVTTSLDRAGFVRLEAYVKEKTGKPVLRDRKAPGAPDWQPVKTVFFDGGAGVDVAAIEQEKPEPKDFDQWWAEQKRLLATVPPEATLRELPDVNGCKNYELTVACYGPRPVTGYLFVPAGAAPKSCKARVAFQGYGTWKQGNPTWMARKGEIALEINAHGYELNRDQAYYNEFMAGIHPPGWGYAFSPEENAKPETAYFRWMAMRVMRALEYVKSRPEWNGKDLIVEGGSQGGLQSSWAAGLDHDVSLARPSIVWGCDFYMVSGPRKRLKGGWHIPYAPGLDYFDSINHVKRAKCPVEITRAGLGDYTCPPSGLAAYYNAIKTPKSILWVQGSQHGLVPPQPNQVFTVSSGHAQTDAESKSQSASADVRAPFYRGAVDFVRDEIHVGINIGNTFDVPSGNETDWGNARVTRELIHAYRRKGFDTVRVPVTWSKRFDHDAKGHPIEPAFLARVKEVVGWCLDEGLVTILNVHHDGGDSGPPFAWLTIDGNAEHEAAAEETLRDLWAQIATAFKDSGERLLFEAFNEVRKAKQYGGPDGKQKGQEDWSGRAPYFERVNRYAKIFAEAVRATGGNNAKRYLMVPTYAAAFQEATCAGWGNPEPDSDRIIADIHCYEPGDFCLWGNRKIHDPAHAEQRLGLFFPLFKKYFTDKGVPLVLGEVNAQRRWLDDLHYSPNDAERMRWARQYAEKARSYGFPIVVWENGGDWDMGLVDRRTAQWTKPLLADTFIAAWHGRLDDATFGKWLDEAKAAAAPPPAATNPGDVVLRWAVGDPENYSGCWGQSMGYGNVNGNGAALKFFTYGKDGTLHVDSHGVGGNMVHQQFWADRGIEARRSWAAWMKAHADRSTNGRSLRFTVTAKNDTSAIVKGFFRVPGIGKVDFGANGGQPGCILATPKRPVVEVSIPLPNGALDPAGKGLGCELQVIPGDWGRNLPLDVDISPIAIVAAGK